MTNHNATAEALRLAGEALLRAADAMVGSKVVPLTPLTDQQKGEQMDAVCTPPPLGHQPSPDAMWLYEARKKWATMLRSFVGTKLNRDNWQQWKRFSQKYGIDVAMRACDRVPADKRWPAEVEAECEKMAREMKEREAYRVQREQLNMGVKK